MPGGRGFLYTESVLRRALTAQTLRLQSISHNIANANTPGFKRSAVSFESALQRELGYSRDNRVRLPLQTTHDRHIPSPASSARSLEARPQVYNDLSTTMRNDGNNVDPDREMAELARTQLVYQVLARRIGEHYRSVRNVIQQGGR